MRDKKNIIKKAKSLGFLKEGDFQKKYNEALKEEREISKEKDLEIKRLENELKKKGVDFNSFLT